MASIQEDIKRFQVIQHLKNTYRWSGRFFHGEKESSADHTWSCLIIADYLLSKLNTLCPGKYQIDKLRVYELLMYHDLLEAETGDVDLSPHAHERHLTRTELEAISFPKLLKKLPLEIQDSYQKSYEEFEARRTLEAKFAKLCDVVESEFQCFFHKDIFDGWTEEYYIKKRESHFLTFPELYHIYEELLDYFRENHYFE